MCWEVGLWGDGCVKCGWWMFEVLEVGVECETFKFADEWLVMLRRIWSRGIRALLA